MIVAILILGFCAWEYTLRVKLWTELRLDPGAIVLAGF